MPYLGTIISESLEHPDVLHGVHIVSTEVEPVTESHKTPWISQWTMHKVEIPEDQVEEFAEKVSKSLDREHTWYADFKNDTTHYIIFRDKVFVVDRKHKEQYEAVVKYGLLLGIPSYQLDFSPEIL